MFREPGYVRPRAGVALRFLIRSHTLLSYLSALGAHRAALPDSAQMAVLRTAAEGAIAALEALAAGLEKGTVSDPGDLDAETAARAALVQAIAGAGADGDPQARTFHTELGLIWLQIDALRSHAREWLQPAAGDTPTAPA
jgi:uncharacterized membrane protein YccC